MWSSAEIDWSTPAGLTLRKLLTELPGDRDFSLTLFGSSPLQLVIEPTFTSAEIDLFSREAKDEVEAAVERAKLQKGEADVYVQVCEEGNFRTSPRWRTRAFTTHVGRVTLTLPHPIDLLIAKLHRCEDKDLRAYRLVIERMGHPTEEEMREELQFAVDLYRPNFDEEMIGDITTNTRVLWNELWKKDIDVRREIIAPALARRRAGYEPDLARIDYRAELRPALGAVAGTAPLVPASLLRIPGGLPAHQGKVCAEPLTRPSWRWRTRSQSVISATMIVEKLKTAAELAVVRTQMDARGQKLVLTNGCFDLLHAGHVRYLQGARSLGEALAVALNGDDSVRALKGPRRPVNEESDRAEVLAALACVDFVVIFHEPRLTRVIEQVKPHIYAKGGDYTVESLNSEERAALADAGAEVRILPLVEGRSTTAMLGRAGASEAKRERDAA